MSPPLWAALRLTPAGADGGGPEGTHSATHAWRACLWIYENFPIGVTKVLSIFSLLAAAECRQAPARSVHGASQMRKIVRACANPTSSTFSPKTQAKYQLSGSVRVRIGLPEIRFSRQGLGETQIRPKRAPALSGSVRIRPEALSKEALGGSPFSGPATVRLL